MVNVPVVTYTPPPRELLPVLLAVFPLMAPPVMVNVPLPEKDTPPP
jgi:hypothetical protein